VLKFIQTKKKFCVNHQECNGFTFHPELEICEIIPYTDIHKWNTEDHGWNVWLPVKN